MSKNHVRPALAAFLLTLTMSLLTTGLSFFITPVCADLGFGRGSFTLYYSLMVAAGAVSASFLGTYMNKHGVRGVVLVSAIWCGVGFWGLSASGALWMFYLVGAAMGLLGSTCLYLCANVIVQQSYSSKDASAVLGVVMAGSGIGGVIWSNVVPMLLDNFGWKFSYRAMGILWLALGVTAVLILGKQDLTGAIGHAAAGSAGANSPKAALKSARFYFVAILMCVVTCASCISQHLPAVLEELGYGDQVNSMVSIMTGSLAVGTVLEGVICSKLGIQKTMAAVVVLYAVGFWLLFTGNLTHFALVCLAFGSGSIGTLMPVVVRQIFGGRDYASIWSMMITISSVVSFLAGPTWGMVYDMLGTYAPALLVMAVLLASSILALIAAFKK